MTKQGQRIEPSIVISAKAEIRDAFQLMRSQMTETPPHSDRRHCGAGSQMPTFVGMTELQARAIGQSSLLAGR